MQNTVSVFYRKFDVKKKNNDNKMTKKMEKHPREHLSETTVSKVQIFFIDIVFVDISSEILHLTDVLNILQPKEERASERIRRRRLKIWRKYHGEEKQCICETLLCFTTEVALEKDMPRHHFCSLTCIFKHYWRRIL